MDTSKCIFVTGATGFIGSKLITTLSERGCNVHALCRPSSNRTGILRDQVRFVEGDITDFDSLVQGMKGCSYVFHLAAYAKNWSSDPSLYYRYNVDGMRNVLNAAAMCGIERIVLTSTIVTFGPTPPGVVGDETMERITPRFYTEYEETKTLAERVALEYAERGLPIVIVNPTRVYGPGKLTEGNSVTLMIDLYDRGKFPILLNNGKNIGNYVYVDDLVEGHIRAMERGKVGERYILGGENVSLKQFFAIIDEVSGKHHVQFNLPPWGARFYGKMNKIAAELFGFYPQITPGWVETFLADWAYSSAKAQRELGYTITPLREGIRRTYLWLCEQRKHKGNK
ncbi:MAG: SDR family oxidoreductase [Bacteroidetes bacterium]|nr:SDR family oxidoreductase [Bacteroidota bacterium]